MDAASHEMLMRRYVRHHAQQANCLKSLLAELDQRFEGIPMRAALCGSGGAALAEALDLPYVQEFGVAEDGVVEEPRIVSGSMVGDTYMRLAAMNELNMHYVSTHFMHPDDLLDVDRGAEEGWEVYKGGFEDYLKWLSAAAPDLRKQTGTECAGAIQRYSQLTVTTESTPTEWTLTLGNFVDEGWLFFRANEGTPGRVTGGELTHLTGNLYLLKANADTIHIEKKGA